MVKNTRDREAWTKTTNKENLMAKKRGDGGLVVLLGAVAAFGLLAYLKTGRGKDNSPLLPDALENQIERVVASLNQIFGRRWVDYALNVLQAQLERTMPGVAGLVDVVYQVEQKYRQVPSAGSAKKNEAVRLVRQKLGR